MTTCEKCGQALIIRDNRPPQDTTGRSACTKGGAHVPTKEATR